MAGAKPPAGDGGNIKAVEAHAEVAHHAKRRVVRKLFVRHFEVGGGNEHVGMGRDFSKLFFIHAVAVKDRADFGEALQERVSRVGGGNKVDDDRTAVLHDASLIRWKM